MENIHLLHLFDGQDWSLATNTRCSRLLKLLGNRTLWRGCRKSCCVRSSVHCVTRETCTLAPSKSSNSMSVLQMPQNSLCPKYLPSSPKKHSNEAQRWPVKISFVWPMKTLRMKSSKAVMLKRRNKSMNKLTNDYILIKDV